MYPILWYYIYGKSEFARQVYFPHGEVMQKHGVQAGNTRPKSGGNPGGMLPSRFLGLTALLMVTILALLLAACGGAASPAATTAPVVPTAAAVPTEAAAPAATATPSGAPAPTAAIVVPTNTTAPAFVSTPTRAPTATAASMIAAEPAADTAGMTTIALEEGSAARYLVREQLARLNFPIDAVGETSDVSGAIVFGDDGRVRSDASMIEVNLATLKSDSDRRDGYVRNRSLQTDTYPLAEFVVQETPGLPWPLPTSGEAAFQMVGDMTVHGVTRPITWDVTAQFGEGTVSGQAKTNFTFSEFEVDIPRVRVVLSVDDHIRLELDFQASVSQ